MVRRIKFRAWDEQYGMLYGDKLEVLHGDIFTGLSYGNLFVARKADYENDWREFKVMQYTGLKDKNGNEIYEGDVLKVPIDGNEDFHGTYSFKEVLFKNGSYIVSYLVSEKGQKLPKGYTAGYLLDLYEYDNKSFLFNEYPSMDTEIEVIGNIYENPNLLESKSHE